MLSSDGFQNLANMVGGFHGSPEAQGWAACGLPVANKAAKERTWEHLKK
jgi:hypothetical protein